MNVVDLDTYRRRRDAKGVDMMAAACMHCGAEFPWGERHDHRCEEGAPARHPSARD